MIFNVPGHIEMILHGVKTQTRRVNRGKYQIGKTYAIQPKRTAKGIEGYRIQILDIYEERYPLIKYDDAKAEGNYSRIEYERTFRLLNPSWKQGDVRWVFKFKCIRV